jgi:hypothetical protein
MRGNEAGRVAMGVGHLLLQGRAPGPRRLPSDGVPVWYQPSNQNLIIAEKKAVRTYVERRVELNFHVATTQMEPT